MKLKYIKTQDDEIIAFSLLIDHIRFKNLDPKSAGFLFINSDENRELSCNCIGESVGLGLKADDEDSKLAKIQFIDAQYIF